MARSSVEVEVGGRTARWLAAVDWRSTAAASTVGTLAISSIAHPGPSQLQVTGTCMQGAGQVSILVKKASGGSWTSLATFGGSCGANAATAGKTATVNGGGLAPECTSSALSKVVHFPPPSPSRCGNHRGLGPLNPLWDGAAPSCSSAQSASLFQCLVAGFDCGDGGSVVFGFH